jgi:cell fate regulator YaaT (PSP1 superfamily)
MFSFFEVIGVNSGAILRKSETLRSKLKKAFQLLSDTFYGLAMACIAAEIQHDELAYI